MKRKACCVTENIVQTVLLIVLAISLILNAVFLTENYRGSIVTYVPDGDSLDLADGRRVRLLGVDAPEVGRCMADQARLRLEHAALGRHVRMKNTLTDSYGRILANVIVEDPKAFFAYNMFQIRKMLGYQEDFAKIDPYLNRALVRDGLAKFTFVRSPYYEVLKSAQETARSMNLGIYSTLCRSTEPPEGCTIKGNIRADTMYFYPETCSLWKQVIVDLSFGDMWLCTVEEAKENGFVLAPGCVSK